MFVKGLSILYDSITISSSICEIYIYIELLVFEMFVKGLSVLCDSITISSSICEIYIYIYKLI